MVDIEYKPVKINKQCRYNWCSAKELISLFKVTKLREQTLLKLSDEVVE